jgi:hypothetical protein
MRVELALALGWPVAQVAELDGAELATLLDILERRHGR